MHCLGQCSSKSFSYSWPMVSFQRQISMASKTLWWSVSPTHGIISRKKLSKPSNDDLWGADQCQALMKVSCEESWLLLSRGWIEAVSHHDVSIMVIPTPPFWNIQLPLFGISSNCLFFHDNASAEWYPSAEEVSEVEMELEMKNGQTILLAF